MSVERYHVIPESRGVYILFIEVARERKISVGRLGTMSFEPGFYAYVGSAMGPGGLRARISRHLRSQKRKFWHIDYLLEVSNIRKVVYVETERKLECVVAREILKRATPIKNFGASDCGCVSHLFRVEGMGVIIDALMELGLKYMTIDVDSF